MDLIITSKIIQSNRDFDYTFQLSQWILKPLGLWWIIFETDKKFNKYLSYLLIIINTFIMLFTIIPGSIYMIFHEKNLSRKIILFGPIGFNITNFIKYYIVIFRINVIKKCFKFILNDWINMVKMKQDRDKMYDNLKFGRNFTIMCAVFLFSGGLSYHTIMPFWTNSNSDASANKTIRPHVYSGYDAVVNSQATPAYELIFSAHVLCAIVVYTITTAACNLAAISASHICGQVDVINSHLRNLVKKKNELSYESTDKRISLIIKNHVRVLRFSAQMEDMLREICLAEVLASTFIICLLEYYCMTEWNNSEKVAVMTYFVVLLSLSFNIFIFCYIGEILYEQCASIGKSTYMIDWYEISGQKGLSLLLIIAMSNYPRKMTAGGLMDLNIRSFGTIIKTTLVYLNMLRTIAD